MNNHQATSDKPFVRLQVEGQRLRVEPLPPEILLALRAGGWDVTDDADHGYRIVASRESLIEPHRPRAGLVYIVAYLLLRTGCEVKLDIQRGPTRLPPPNLDSISWLGAPDANFLDFLRRNASGIVRHVPGAIDLAWLVAQAVIAYPSARVGVVVQSRSQAKRFARRLRRWIPSVGLATSRRGPGKEYAVTVSTWKGLGEDHAEAWYTDILFVMDARQAAAEQAVDPLLGAEKARVFGFLPVGTSLPPRHRDTLAQVFGLDELLIAVHGAAVRPVRVGWVDIHGGHQLPLSLDGPALKRAGAQHDVRTRRITTLAAALVASDRDGYLDICPDLAVISEPMPGVIVVAESIDHALHLAERLTGWPILTGPDVVEEGLSEKQIELLRERGSLSASGHAIITVAALRAMPRLDFEVLIWAAGGPHGPRILPSQLTCSAADARPLVLIDSDDRHHPLLRRWSRFRGERYLDEGWFDIGVDVRKARVERFLAIRETPR